MTVPSETAKTKIHEEINNIPLVDEDPQSKRNSKLCNFYSEHLLIIFLKMYM